MRAVLQRVKQASVSISGSVYSSIGSGMMVLLGVENPDGEEDIKWLSKKLINLRIFDDSEGVMNLSLIEMKGELLLISQFTLFADTKKGNRPSYLRASKPETAMEIYRLMIIQLEQDLGKKIMTGVFGADMQVSLLNDGPVTLLIDTRNRDL